ncbi:TPA: hypothetical protein DCF80_01405 [Candidatus Saccharibacteria bacterium]|nr:hypothetical protein [Candidatus Saccharibacteria bacterium]HRK41199.1 hypothetical protein [Candidatus Saccharibacteria bacterium]
MASRKKSAHPAAVDSSHTVFFLFLSASASMAFGSLFLHTISLAVAIFIGALLIYVIQDLARQVYSAGEAMLLVVLSLFILPFVMGFIGGGTISRLAIVVYIFSLIGAGILELLYNLIITRKPLGRLHLRLLNLDTKVDRSTIKLSNYHLTLMSYRGLVFGISLMVGYVVLVYCLGYLISS